MRGRESAFQRLRRIAGLERDESEPTPYRCRTCDTPFELQYHVCPQCGGYNVNRDEGSAVNAASDR